MKTIFKGKLYDTERSEYICGFTNRSIWKGKNGTLFMTCENDTTKEKVIYVDEIGIRDFIGEYFPDIYIKLFGEVEEA